MGNQRITKTMRRMVFKRSPSLQDNRWKAIEMDHGKHKANYSVNVELITVVKEC